MKRTQPKPRKNARKYDSNNVIDKGQVISTRMSDHMKGRTVKAAQTLGCKTTSDVVNIALIRFLNHLPEIAESYEKSGIIPMQFAALKAFQQLGPAPEEIEYARSHANVDQLLQLQANIAEMLEELKGRLEVVERRTMPVIKEIDI